MLVNSVTTLNNCDLMFFYVASLGQLCPLNLNFCRFSVLADQGAKVDAPHVFSADNPFVAEISSPASPVGSTYSTPTKEEDPKMAGPSERPLGSKPRKQSG